MISNLTLLCNGLVGDMTNGVINEPLSDIICILCTIILGLLIGLLIREMYRRRYIRFIKRYNSEDWDFVIKKGSFLLNIPLMKNVVDDMHYMLAVAYFERYDDEKFLQQVNMICDKNMLNRKHHLLAIYSVVTENGEFERWKKALELSINKKEKDKFLAGLERLSRILKSENYDKDLSEYLEQKCSARLKEYLISRK